MALAEEAAQMIIEHKLDDTFYMIDLGNVTRMYKVCDPAAAASRGDLGGAGDAGRRRACVFQEKWRPLLELCMKQQPLLLPALW